MADHLNRALHDALTDYGRAVVNDAHDRALSALHDARRIFRLKRMLRVRPVVGWNPALERVTDGASR